MTKGLLAKYNEKRNFSITAEPRGKTSKKTNKKLKFVIQLHEATRTHYDFRLEWHGVMKSWAVTKGPSYNPEDKRLAVRTEDHPMDYNKFEGVIPDKQYGAGPVMIWDEGFWAPDGDPAEMEKKGHIAFVMDGTRMKGHWHLIRMRTTEKRENWLLVKGKDEFVLNKRDNEGFLKRENVSVVTGRTMVEIQKAGLGLTAKRKKGKIEKSDIQDNKPRPKLSTKSAGTIKKLIEKYSEPELATLVTQQPSGDDWVHEIKYDGYRLMAFIYQGQVTLRTRGGKDWTHKFTPLATALAALKIESAVLDLEACVLDSSGKTNFSALQAALSDDNPEKIEGWIFDLLYLDGKDLTKTPLLDRKSKLASLLKKAKSPLHYSEHFESAPDLLIKACEIGAEGLVSKKKDSLYYGRRTHDWVKSKCGLEQEFVIGGFMPAKDFPKAIGALLLGYYKNKKFTYAGKVGTGFSQKLAKEIFQKLISFKVEESPFSDKVGRGLREYTYVEPIKLCEISFMEWTPDGHIRHGSFKGLREDKNPKAVVEEVPMQVKDKANGKKPSGKKTSGLLDVGGITISHPDRLVFPTEKITKGDLATYYSQVAPLMLPFIKDRLISLLRCTDGINGECFFQRNPMRGLGDAVKSQVVNHEKKKHKYLYLDKEIGILQLVQMGTIEFHAWQNTIKNEDKPNQIIFDLDPDEAVPFEAVKLAAQDIRQRLSKLKLISFPRLSGGKGIHVVVPIKTEHSWEDVKEFARSFSENLAKDVPDVYVANMSKKRRTGKIFIDFFRNDFSSTAVVPFSVRAREGAPIAWPISWAALKKYKKASDISLLKVTAKMLKDAEAISLDFLNTKQRLIIN